MLKYENVANVGDRIRAYDFETRDDCYIEGVIITKDVEGTVRGYSCFVVRVDADVCPPLRRGLTDPMQFNDATFGNRVGATCYVPMQCAWSEWDGRVVKA